MLNVFTLIACDPEAPRREARRYPRWPSERNSGMQPFIPGTWLLCLMIIIEFPSQPVLKKVVNASGAVDYNVLQNNGTIAHQEVPHVCCPASVPRLITLLTGKNRCTFTWYISLLSSSQCAFVSLTSCRSRNPTSRKVLEYYGKLSRQTWTSSRLSVRRSSRKCEKCTSRFVTFGRYRAKRV